MIPGSTRLVTKQLLLPGNPGVPKRGMVTLVVMVMALLMSVQSNECPAWKDPNNYGVKDHLLPFGADVDMTPISLPLNDPWVHFSQGFTYFGQEFDRMRVVPQGFVFFNSSSNICSRDVFPFQDYEKVIAPLWSSEDHNGFFRGQVFFREIPPGGEDANGYCLLDYYVRNANVVPSNFKTTWAFVVTWFELQPNDDASRDLKNTFQLVLFSGGGMSFALFNYDSITWSAEEKQDCSSRNVQVGFSAGNDVDYYDLAQDDDSSSLINHLQFIPGALTNLPQRWLFRVDRRTPQSSTCKESGRIYGITPKTGHPFGGYVLTITGYCAEVTSSPVCRFGDVRVAGKADDGVMTCLVPNIGVRGRVIVKLSVDNEKTFPAYAVIQIGTRDRVFPISLTSAEVWLALPPTGPLLIETKYQLQHTEPLHLEMVTFTGNGDQMVAVRLAENIDTSSTIEIEQLDFEVLNPDLIIPLATFGALSITSQSNGPSLWSSLIGADWYILKLLQEVLKSPGSGVVEDDSNVYSAILTLAREAGVDINSGSDVISFLRTNLTDILHVIFTPRCETWSQSEAIDLRYLSAELPPSPVNEKHAYYDPDYQPDPNCNRENHLCPYSPGAHSCYHYQHHIAGKFGLRVCYDISGNIISNGDYVLGTTEVHSPFWDSVAFYWREIRPYYYCCRWSSNCALYREKRTVPEVTGYVPVKAAWTGGDPHYRTLDGIRYTFNGVGEYWLVKTDFLKIQGRTIPAKDTSGQLQASVWQSFAAKTNTSSLIEIQQDDSREGGRGAVILVDSELVDHEYFQIEKEPFDAKGLFISIKDDVVSVTFDKSVCSGAELRVNMTLLPQMVLTLTKCYRGRLKGLLGNFNGNASDDLQTVDGELFPTDSNLSVYHSVSESWRTLPADSLFTYPPDKTHASYQDTSFIPYLPEVSDLRTHPGGASVCGNSPPCLYDLKVFGDEQLARATFEGVMIFENITNNLKPNVTCPQLEAPSDGQIVSLVVLYVPGDIIEFRCNKGATSNGTLKLRCEPDGTWDGTPATCYVDPTRKDLILIGILSSVVLGIVVAVIVGLIIRQRSIAELKV